MIKQIVSLSSGVDSQATAMMAVERFGSNVILLFCDTGNEHPLVYEHLDYLERELGIKIHRLKADFKNRIMKRRLSIANDKGSKISKKLTNKQKRRILQQGLKYSGNPMLDLCQARGFFPRRIAQFCTGELKINLLQEYQAHINIDNIVINWQGVRRDESRNRSNAMIFESVTPTFHIYRPIVDMTKPEVFKYVKSRGLKYNPLYDFGLGRVGCLPCVNANKKELRLIAKHFPEHIKRIREWEQLVGYSSKIGYASLFNPRTIGLKPKDAYEEANIDATVLWAKTTYGGRQFLLFEDQSETCILSGGQCE